MGLREIFQAVREYPTACADLETARTALEESEQKCRSLTLEMNGTCVTAPITTCPKRESVFSLSDILIPDAPEKYFLSKEQTAKLLYSSSEGPRAPESTTRQE